MTIVTLPERQLDQPEPEPAPPRNRRRRWLVLLLVAVLLVGGGLAARTWWPRNAEDIRSGTTLVDADGLAARYGIKVSLLAVTAAGGLIELRYQVVDPDKADQVQHDADLLPALVVEDSGATLVLRNPPHHHASPTVLGGTYFVLFANARNAIHPGARVTLVLGDVRIEHIEAQG
jgi:hypothetical protein